MFCTAGSRLRLTGRHHGSVLVLIPKGHYCYCDKVITGTREEWKLDDGEAFLMWGGEAGQERDRWCVCVRAHVFSGACAWGR